jgi:hypothetical protein
VSDRTSNIILGCLIGLAVIILLSSGCAHAPDRPPPCTTCPSARSCPLEGLPTDVDPPPAVVLGCKLAGDQVIQGLRLVGYECGIVLGEVKVACMVTLCGAPSDPADTLGICYAVCVDAPVAKAEPPIEL